MKINSSLAGISTSQNGRFKDLISLVRNSRMCLVFLVVDQWQTFKQGMRRTQKMQRRLTKRQYCFVWISFLIDLVTQYNLMSFLVIT